MRIVSSLGRVPVSAPAVPSLTVGALLAALLAPVARPAAAGVLLINDTYKVVRFNAQTGALIDTLVPAGTGGLQFVTSMAWGPDGNLYVGDSGSSSILRFNGATGAFIDTFVPAATGGLDYPASLTFGPDGNLYASNVLRPNFNSGPVLRFNGTTGAFMDAFVPAGTGGLGYPWNLLFRADGYLFVGDPGSGGVLRYNGTSGAFVDAFVASGAGGLAGPKGLATGPDGNLYVSSAIGNQVLRYNGSTGAFIDAFVPSVASPNGLAFGPDQNLYVGSSTATSIGRYNGTTGALMSTFIPAGTGGLGSPRSVLFLPPAAPSGLTASVVSNSQVNLTWTDNSDDETAFAIWRQGGGAGWARVGIVGPNTTTFSDTSLSGSTAYTYQVRAISNMGASPWSNQAGATTWPPPPAPPTTLIAIPAGTAQVNLTWTVPNSNQTAIAVWRRSCSGAYTRIAALAPTASGFNDTGLSASTTYLYRVRAVNSYYPSTWSNEAAATTGP